MKRTLMVPPLVMLLGMPAAWAEEAEQPVTYRHEWQGMGVGALVGAIAAGPPGLVIGAAGGALIGRHEGLESELAAARQTLDGLEHQTAEQELKLLKQAQQLEEQQSQRQRQIEAMIQGFSLNIHFRTKSTALEPRFIQQLDALVGLLRELPQLKVHIDAFADRRGSNAFNHNLARQRAQVVSRRLQAAGVEIGRIHQLSHGENRAEYPISDAEGMDFDRRVLLYLSRSSS